MLFESDSLSKSNVFSTDSRPSASPPKISFVIPLKDEEATISQLVDGISENVQGIQHEIILVDDGSKDWSWSIIQDLAITKPGVVRGIRFRSNRGKAAALAVGFEAAQGEIIFTMDADLQDDPTEIPRFLAKLEEGYDLVSGWKQVRHDPWHKVLPSRIFNRMLSRVSKVKLHDHNCGFKCYRKSVAKSIRLFGELHRMVPALSGMQGFQVAEIPVKHHARRFGKSKYGIERFIRGFSDMLTIGFLRTYQERPSHFTNACALAFALIGLALATSAMFMGIANTEGLLLLSAALILVGMGGSIVILGLLSELMIRTNHIPHAKASVVETVSYPIQDASNAFPPANRFRNHSFAEQGHGMDSLELKSNLSKHADKHQHRETVEAGL